jgi:hypothetical protein
MTEEQAVVEILNLTHALTGIGGAGTTAVIAGLVYRFTKKDLQEGLVSKDELKEHLDEIINDISDLKSLNKDRIHNEKDLYEKTNILGQRVSTIEGQLSK